jgi:signal transduction histidine kinase
MILARWIAAPWVFVQVLTYSTMPYPPGVRTLALILAAALLIGNVLLFLLRRRAKTRSDARVFAFGGLAFDILVGSAFVWLYAFDETTATWAVLFILPLEGALLFSLLGALGSWAAVTALYAGQQVWAANRYGFPVLAESVSFIGIGLLIALVAGLMARDLLRQRAKVGRALDDLRRVDSLRATLVSTLAHDVRNPLTAIRGALATIRSRGADLGEPQVARLLEVVDRQSERLERLSLGLLELARLERGTLTLEFETIALRPAVERAMGFVPDGSQVEVRVPPQLSVRADPARLEQVLVNLITNALDHGQAPFVIEATHRDGWVTLEVCDRGPGVPAERQGVLFEPFRSGEAGGSVGLGLAIVKGLVEAHGGRVSYRPNEPRGSRFTIELPSASKAEPTTRS